MKLNDVTRGTGLEEHGIRDADIIFWTPPTSVLYEHVVRRREGLVTHMGALAVKTGHYTGRAANEKFIVDDAASHAWVDWGKVNQPFDPARFDALYKRMASYVNGKELFVQDCFAGARPKHRLPIRVITERAWHSLFARNMFIQAAPEELTRFSPGFTLIDLPGFHASPTLDGTHTEAFIVVNLTKKLIIIGGTSYAGEIKKSVFTVMNYYLPKDDRVLSMHCSANVGPKGDVAVFFGLSGTGKTTLSAVPDRALIGDDEHGWDDEGVFNFEGGCYAKVIALSRESEPEIFEATRKFGTVLENVGIDSRTRRVDLDDRTLTENTRASYPIGHIPNIEKSRCAGHPCNIVMLTCDAFGVLPPVTRLTEDQAVYHFLSGYTAKVAGTEAGLTEPQTTFSSCFGAPFMALHPSVYAELLREKISRHKVDCWLVNTGWTGGGYGEGRRIPIAHSRAMVRAALDGSLAGSEFRRDPVFQMAVPKACPGVPEAALDPRRSWKDKALYDAAAKKLVDGFRANFEKFKGKVPETLANVI